jgi:hypothetical protein
MAQDQPCIRSMVAWPRIMNEEWNKSEKQSPILWSPESIALGQKGEKR